MTGSLFSGNGLFGMYTSFLSCLFSWLTLMKSLVLQWQITQQELELKMIAAVAEFWKTCKQTPPPTHISIAEKYRVPDSTLKACILGWTSKIDAAAAWQNIHLCEEEVLVVYLKETACCGFPDTRKHCVQHANEILHACTGNPSDHVSQSKNTALTKIASSQWMKHAVFLTRTHQRLDTSAQQSKYINWPYTMRFTTQQPSFPSSQPVGMYLDQL